MTTPEWVLAVRLLRAMFPDFTVETDNYGQLVIYTGLLDQIEHGHLVPVKGWGTDD